MMPGDRIPLLLLALSKWFQANNVKPEQMLAVHHLLVGMASYIEMMHVLLNSATLAVSSADSNLSDKDFNDICIKTKAMVDEAHEKHAKVFVQALAEFEALLSANSARH